MKSIDVGAIRSNGVVYLSSEDLLKVLRRDLEGTGDYDNDPVNRNTADYIDELIAKLTEGLAKTRPVRSRVRLV